jgi:hypothetical protein
MQEIDEGKVPVCVRKDYIMYFEYFKDNIWFHTDIFKWTAEVKKRYKKDVSQLLSLVDCPVAAMIREEDTKLKRFAESFGWIEKCQIVLIDGSKAYIYASKRNKGE